MSRHALFVFLSDLSLVVLIAGCVGFAISAWRRRRRSRALHAFAYFSGASALFFGWFSIVYLDRRCPWCIPGIDLVQWMGYEWYWPFRTMLACAYYTLWRTLIRGAR